VEASGFRLRVHRAGGEARPGDEPGAPAPEGEAIELGAEDLEDMLALIEDSGFDVVELETPELKARVHRSGAPPASAAGPEEEAEAEAPATDGLVEITAPLVGTFYRARSPGAPPFVEVGSSVSEETEVCIIEAMKLMNYIPAGVRGTVAEVVAENEQAVESGTPLFRVQPDGA
jgi:biotin carboxyl carrier protein